VYLGRFSLPNTEGTRESVRRENEDLYCMVLVKMRNSR
jgi:hypothetical protein